MAPIKGLIDKYVLHRPQQAPPPISTGAAVALLVFYTAVYVVPFYLSKLTRPSLSLSRDAPSVIRARITSVSLSCLFCSCITFYILTNGKATSPPPLLYRDALHHMGYYPLGVSETAKALLLTAGLFLGPLFEQLIVERGWRTWAGLHVPGEDKSLPPPRVLEPVWDLLSDWGTWRNLVAGPVTEEVLFRAAAVPLLLLAGTSVRGTVLLSPIVFGLAHVHHAYEFAITHPRTPKIAVALRSLFQFTYTTIFGCYATFVFLRTGSLLSVCVIHSFCNAMGLPRFYGRVERSPYTTRPADDNHPRGNLLWTIAYYILLVVGAVYWYRHLWTLTESSMALMTFK